MNAVSTLALTTAVVSFPLTSYVTTTPWATNTSISNILDYYENTSDGLNNTDKLYIVVVECLLYLFYYEDNSIFIMYLYYEDTF